MSSDMVLYDPYYDIIFISSTSVYSENIDDLPDDYSIKVRLFSEQSSFELDTPCIVLGEL